MTEIHCRHWCFFMRTKPVTDLASPQSLEVNQSGGLPRVLFDPERGRVLAGLMMLFALRVVYLLICPLELVPDEAYYWDWSRQLDWNYYSKPPLIAWLIALATAIGGDSEFSIRVPAAALGTFGLWGVYELGRHLYSHQAGVWAAAIVVASPGMTALCLLMTIDAPFLLFWTLAVYCLWRMLESHEPDGRWVLPAILATGAALLTKQSALGLFPLTLLFLSMEKADRTKFRSHALWQWLIGSAACLLPIVWWNFTHGWIMLGHTRDHFAPRSVPILNHVASFAEFLVVQFGVLSPIICGQLLVVTAVLLTRIGRLPRRERFLLCFGGLPLVAVTALSFVQRVQPNWAVALHLTGVILMAAWSCGEISLSPRLDAWRRLVPAGVGLGTVVSVCVAFAPFVIPESPLAGSKFDPTIRLRGWKELGRQVANTLNSFPHADDILVVAATPRGPVSELSYYLPDKPRVYRWNVGGVIDSQHDIWGGPKDGAGRDALILTDGHAELPNPLATAFDTIEELTPAVVVIGLHRTRHYRLWRGTSLRAWPESTPLKPVVAIRSLQDSQEL